MCSFRRLFTASILLLWACSSDKGVTVHNTGPSASILEPVDGATFDEGESVEFVALVDDAQDPSDELEVRWASDLDGAMDESPGDSLGDVRYATSALSPGLHTIVLTVVDTSGENGTDNIQLEILDINGLPTVTIVSPTSSEHGEQDRAFAFKAHASDREDPVVELIIRMGSALEGDTGDEGEFEFFCETHPNETGIANCEATLETGLHVLVFEAEDSDGNIDQATISFSVVSDSDVDNDFDGYSEADGDCDDADNDIHPGAEEACNGVDDDCDGEIDEEPTSFTTTYWPDVDADGFGDADGAIQACEPSVGFVANADDCDDADANVNPDADEQCNDLDDDCDGEIDESGSSGEATWYTDGDDDGFGDSATASVTCDGLSDAVSVGGDCDDANAAIHPDADEICNDVDDNCDGAIDEDGAIDAPTYYRDLDDDTFGDADESWATCDAPSGGWVLDDGDCDDLDDDIHPDAEELCDGDDNDCDDEVDESDSTDAATWYPDADGDTYGVTTGWVLSCTAPEGFISRSGDCDDDDDLVNPDATELCDGVDNDCDSAIDESDAEDASVWYWDGDEDDYGHPDVSVTACTAPLGYLSTGGDCDDSDEDVFPGATEVCNGHDDDCDEEIDESGAVGESSWYRDYDLDGYGDESDSTEACDEPTGYVSDKTDCNDTSSDAYPGHPEACDGIDNDCDTLVDEEDSTGCTTYYRDYDDDGYGSTLSRCTCTPVGHYTSYNSSDCYDTNDDAYPGVSAWHTSSRGDGSYDYSCDGSQEKRYPSRAGSCALLTDACGADNGWSSSAPSCGSTGTWKSGCYLTLSGCYWSSSSSRTQSCR